MFRRMVIVACFLVAADLLLLASLSYFWEWTYPLIASVLSTALGIGVILYYEFRWSRVVAEHFDSRDATRADADAFFCLEKILLFAAGVFLIIPGTLTDFVGLLLLSPAVRQPVARLLHSRATERLHSRATGESRPAAAFLPDRSSVG
jgi:UPF0716 protein FxsA